MMRMAMRPQKTQLAAPITTYTENGVFDRTRYCMFGYTDYEAVLVGGGGGRSGVAVGRTVGTKTTHVESSGGGGGGFIRLKGKLSDLSVSSSIDVGSVGADGSDSANGVRASKGSDGGSTTFNGYSALGGQGGWGGGYDVTIFGVADQINRGAGGHGGLNSASYGEVGDGGEGAFAEGENLGSQTSNPGTPPTAGTVSDGHSGVAIAGGGGGGGGAGRVRLFDVNQEPGFDGAAGSTGPGNYDVAGSPAGDSQNPGGAGGGCNPVDLTAVSISYGTNGSGSGFRVGKGAAFIKLS